MRWDGDTRSRGVADAAAFAEGAAELVESMRLPDWVAEEPEAHLLPHLRAACDGLPLELMQTRVLDDGAFEVELNYTGENGASARDPSGRVRADRQHRRDGDVRAPAPR